MLSGNTANISCLQKIQQILKNTLSYAAVQYLAAHNINIFRLLLALGTIDADVGGGQEEGDAAGEEEGVGQAGPEDRQREYEHR